MRVAVVHDYFIQLGGAEKVTEEIVRMMPGSALFSTVALPSQMPKGLVDQQVHTSWMQHLPELKKWYRAYFPLYPFAVQSLDLSDFDLIISSSSGYAKGVRTRPDAVHVCYCHTPMRWVWSFDDYSARENMGNFKRRALGRMMSPLRHWDLKASRQPDYYVANSRNVANRIKLIYGRSSQVIHPPIDLSRFQPSREQGDYYLVLARLVSYKRIDIAVEACTRLGRQLVVIGEGPDRARLQELAGPTVRFLGRLSDSEVEHYASRCRALLFPGEEDFGMAPLEIAAAGRPTIAYRAGGAVETIIEGKTGAFFDQQDPVDVMRAIEEFEQKDWPSHVLSRHAKGFSSEVFQNSFKQFLADVGFPQSLPAVMTA